MVDKVQDRILLLGIIVFLGLTVLSCAIGGMYLANGGKTIPDAVIALGSGALGGLVGVLVKSD